MKVHHHVRAFELLLNNYDGKLPLHRFLVNYFKANKQMGSADRRWASRYIYAFFRLGNALAEEDRLKRLAIADFLCNSSNSLVIDNYAPELSAQIEKPLADKLVLVKSLFSAFELKDLFPFSTKFSPSVDMEAFYPSLLVQPDLFIRVKETHIDAIGNILRNADVSFSKIGDNSIALPNGTKLEQIINDQRLYQVQDLSSQRTGEWFKPLANEEWWDCCAASGGKSLLLHSLEPSVSILASDVRETSLGNLKERFEQAGIKKYQRKVIDLMQNNDSILHHHEFDGILVDAPCSGSGTWGRTPEMLNFFDESKVDFYHKLQTTIALNASKYLKKRKPLIYMTCSVFKKENEDVVEFLLANTDLQLESMELIKGYTQQADSLFVARFVKA